jgi:DNA repair protein RecN (Recombination protein N)
MIEELHISGLGVIEDAVLELSPGLTVLTGETGAGKTMVVSGLGLLLGGRADAGAVRAGSRRTLVEGRLRLDPVSETGAAAATRADDLGAEVEDGVLTLARAVAGEQGRSRAWIGGRSVPVTALAELTGPLVAVHGQADQLRLLAPSQQLDALDRYVGPAVLGQRDGYAKAYERLSAVRKELAEFEASRRERLAEADRLRFGLGEIAAVAPRPGEDVELDLESRRLSAADGLRSGALLAHAALAGDPEAPADTGESDVIALLGVARRALDHLRDDDPAVAGLAERVADVSAAAADVAADLSTYADGIEADPGRLAAVEERRAAVRGLTRKYGASAAEVLAWATDAEVRLAEIDPEGDRIGALAGEQASLLAELGGLAAELSTLRAGGAEQFGKAVTAELADLAMPHARIEVSVRQADAAGGDLLRSADGLEIAGRRVHFGPTGVDTVEIALVAHAGAPARPLSRGASGGELSRVMLAVEVVFAGADPVPTFVFDEVDAGVGGKSAVEVGRRLARLARGAQVLVVTHLPQVAAFADRHLVVRKSSDGSVVQSGVVALDPDQRLDELTRMLAGLEGSESGRVHAEELLATADAAKADDARERVGAGTGVNGGAASTGEAVRTSRQRAGAPRRRGPRANGPA